MKQAMIFAAGLGTRLRPITDTMPKALVPVGGKPLLWHVIEKLRRAGVGRIVVNVHHFAQQIKDYIAANDGFGLDMRISDETAMLLDTGGGIRKARPLFDADSPVLIHNVDILSDADIGSLYATIESRDGTTDAALLVSPRPSSRALAFDAATMRLTGWHNLNTDESRGHVGADSVQLAFSGIHIISPKLLRRMDTWPERFGIIDFYLDACPVTDIVGVNTPALRLLDIGKLSTLAEADGFAASLTET